MTGLIFAKTMRPTTTATVIAVCSRSNAVSVMSVHLRPAGAGGAAGLDRRTDGAPDGDPLLGRGALERTPEGDVLEACGATWWVPLGHGGLRGARGVRSPLPVDC